MCSIAFFYVQKRRFSELCTEDLRLLFAWQYSCKSLSRNMWVIVIQHVRQYECRLIHLALSAGRKWSIHLLRHLLTCQSTYMCALSLAAFRIYIISEINSYLSPIYIYPYIYAFWFVRILSDVGKYIVGYPLHTLKINVNFGFLVRDINVELISILACLLYTSDAADEL